MGDNEALLSVFVIAVLFILGMTFVLMEDKDD